MNVVAVMFAVAFAAAWFLTGVARRAAIRRGILDQPNARSSHVVPVPRGGGVAIVLVVLAAVAWATVHGETRSGLAWLIGGGAIAGVGVLDDRFGLRPSVRFAVHFCAAALLVWSLGGFPPLDVMGVAIDLGFVGVAFGVIGVIWSINLFNFMDGIDGIAASQAAFVCAAGVLLGLGHASLDASLLPLAVVAAALGFLVWNWPPAKIFMGDAGSGFLGFAVAAIALGAWRSGVLSIWSWLLLHAAFLTDATVTLVTRLLTGERVWEAHRKHAYQRLARHWRSHRRVTLAYVAVNTGWLLPLAWFAQLRPAIAPLLAGIGFVPLVLACLLIGAGRPGEIGIRDPREG